MLKSLITLTIGCLISVSLAGDFILNSLDEAKNLSNSTNQSILLIFGTSNCVFCRSLENDLYNSMELQDATEKYIICYIDLKNNPEYKETYKISIIPDSRIITKNIQTKKISGYNKEKYIKWLK
jgi:thioredoxin-related protein